MLQIPDLPIVNLEAQNLVRERQTKLAKPAGSLGVLEVLSLRLAAITGQTTLQFPRKGVVILAADEGLAPAGDSHQQASLIAQGGASVSVLARQAGATVTVVDLGLRQTPPPADHLHSYKVAYGSKNIAYQPALSVPEVSDAFMVGQNVASQEIAQGCDVLVVSALGAGGELVAAGVAAALLGQKVAEVAPPGSPAEQINLLQNALEHYQPDLKDPLDVVRCVGGLTLAGLAGLMLTAASGRVPLILDSAVAYTAALIASELNFQIRPYLMAAHQPTTAGEMAILRRLGLRPLLDLDLKIGDGSAGVLAFHLVEAAARTLNEMAQTS